MTSICGGMTWNSAVLAFLVLQTVASSALAESNGQKKKRAVEKKYEVVAWGPKQRLTENLRRTYDACTGSTFEVAAKRYKEVKEHYDEVVKKFHEHNVDWKKEPTYFDVIEWTSYDSITGLPSDHWIRFYVAARKRGNSSAPKRPVAYLEQRTDRNRAQQWELYDVGNRQHAIQNVRKREFLLDYTGNGNPFRVALFEQKVAERANMAQRWLFLDPRSKKAVSSVKQGDYVIQNARSGKVLDYDDDRIVLTDLTRGNTNRAQIWRLRKVGKNTFMICNVRRAREGKGEALDFRNE